MVSNTPPVSAAELAGGGTAIAGAGVAIPTGGAAVGDAIDWSSARI